MVKDYKVIIKEGNVIYGSILPIHNQPNLSVEEVIQHSNKDLQLYMPKSFQGITDANALANELFSLAKKYPKYAGVLNIPPDKSVALCMSQGMLCFLDSHRHHNCGAVIAFADQSKVFEMCHYLEQFFL